MPAGHPGSPMDGPSDAMSQDARRLFALPPFPGARPHRAVRAKPGHRADGTPEALIDAWRAHRLTPGFWQADNEGAARRHSAIGTLAHRLSHPGDAAAEAALRTDVDRRLLRDLAYHDPFTGAPIAPAGLIAILADWRDLVAANRPIAAAFGFARWKRDTVAPLLWGGRPVPFRPARIAALERLPQGATIAVWKARVPDDFLERLESGRWRVMEVEDGFIRSVGLGADCVPPLSIVVDDIGIHYDWHRPSRLERMLREGQFDAAMLARAARLREWLVREGVGKYGVGAHAALPRPAGDRRHILVVGQVEDDRSVRYGSTDVRSNLDLLRRVRAGAPDAFIIYRPHPDVEAGHRRGAIPADVALRHADSIDAASPISALIAMVDEVHVITSLAGFEALMQHKTVATHGVPFFAGWGLTQNLAAIPTRRDVDHTLEELIVATLLQYPRYLDPVTGLPCTAEVLVQQLISGIQRQNGLLVRLRRMQGRLTLLVSQITGAR